DLHGVDASQLADGGPRAAGDLLLASQDRDQPGRDQLRRRARPRRLLGSMGSRRGGDGRHLRAGIRLLGPRRDAARAAARALVDPARGTRRRGICYTGGMTAPRTVAIGNISIANDRPFALIAGPCQLESRAHALEMSQALVELTGKLGVGLVYKTSF